MKPVSRHTFTWPTAAALLLLVGACSSGDDPTPGTDPPDPDPPTEATAHDEIALLDRYGNPLTVDSTEPYSPRRTCGACHDIDAIANGYHFQQGRTGADGSMEMTPDFNGDGRTWLLSAGMLGKW